MTKDSTNNSKFTDQYKHPNWQKKRLEILERDEFTCRDCGDTESTLHVHHIMYIYGRDIWDYDNAFYITVCDSCHKYIHGTSSADFINNLNEKRFSIKSFEVWGRIFGAISIADQECGCGEQMLVEVINLLRKFRGDI